MPAASPRAALTRGVSLRAVQAPRERGGPKSPNNPLGRVALRAGGGPLHARHGKGVVRRANVCMVCP